MTWSLMVIMHLKLFTSVTFREERFPRGSYDRTGYPFSLPINWALMELNKLNNMIYAVSQMKQE